MTRWNQFAICLMTSLMMANPLGWTQEELPTSKRPPTLFVAGDSTANNGSENGWGSHLQSYFDATKLTVVNRARGGRSSRTFVTEGLWDSLQRELKAGDTVLIQFGHNDAGAINDASRARGSIPTLNDESQEIENQVTGEHEIVHSFGWYLRHMIEGARSQGATPIVMNMTARNVWSEGQLERTNTFCRLAQLVAEETETPFIDLRNIIADQYELLGPIRVRELFPKDHTHTGSTGAELNAAMVVSGLKTLEGPLTAHCNERGEGISAYSPNLMIEPVKSWMTSSWMPDAQPASDPDQPTLFAIGDSTVRTGTRGDGSNGQWGWGAPLADYFDRTRLNVENRALGGTSSRTFRTQGLWQEVLARINPGDFVIMQFGHNDSSPLNDALRARGTIKGNGDEVQQIINAITGKEEVVHTYGWYIRQYIQDTKAKGATPIVCSPIPRNNWTDGKVHRSVDSYGQWAAEAARAENVPFIDLNQLVCDHYDSVGRERVAGLYFDGQETTHTNAMGAQQNARCLVQGIRALSDCPLADYLRVVTPQ